MLHCDIRPCNFLVDEYGILKLSDFKNVRKIPKEPLGETPMGSRGTPDYMSPELFTEEGMHSYQSDFWAIGESDTFILFVCYSKAEARSRNCHYDVIFAFLCTTQHFALLTIYRRGSLPIASWQLAFW